MKIPIKEILTDYKERTGIRITQDQLAGDLVKKGIYTSHGSAVNSLQHCQKGRIKCFNVELLKYLRDRFNIDYNQIMKP
jgi:hypothetical protein